MYRGQAQQDKFVLHVLKHKKNGFFVEIGSAGPIKINNTYVLENSYNWKGIMVEYNRKYLKDYKLHRPNSIHIINDARTINYKQEFSTNNVPEHIDYLQIDLEVTNGSTMYVLQKLDNEIFDKYTFATITFEHDVYHSNYLDTRNKSRNIFEKRGYKRVFTDVNNQGSNPYEDWYVHPDLVDMEYINELIIKNKKHYKQNVKSQQYFTESVVTESINWQDIEY
jgi:hypothetical protein